MGKRVFKIEAAVVHHLQLQLYLLSFAHKGATQLMYLLFINEGSIAICSDSKCVSLGVVHLCLVDGIKSGVGLEEGPEVGWVLDIDQLLG